MQSLQATFYLYVMRWCTHQKLTLCLESQPYGQSCVAGSAEDRCTQKVSVTWHTHSLRLQTEVTDHLRLELLLKPTL